MKRAQKIRKTAKRIQFLVSRNAFFTDRNYSAFYIDNFLLLDTDEGTSNKSEKIETVANNNFSDSSDTYDEEKIVLILEQQLRDTKEKLKDKSLSLELATTNLGEHRKHGIS